MKFIFFFVLLTTCSVQFAACGREEHHVPTPFSVMTFNVHHMVDEKGESSQAAVAAFILEQNPDIVLLQELDNGADRTGNVDQLAQLQVDTGYGYAHFNQMLELEGGGYGIGVLSKHPFVSLEDIHLDLPACEQGPTYERRGAIFAKVQIGNQVVNVFNTHLHYSEVERDEQWKMLRNLVSAKVSNSEYLLLGGDFNAYASILDAVQPVALNNESEGEEIDHIFTQGLAAPSRSVRNGAGLSDHLAYSVNLELP